MPAIIYAPKIFSIHSFISDKTFSSSSSSSVSFICILVKCAFLHSPPPFPSLFVNEWTYLTILTWVSVSDIEEKTLTLRLVKRDLSNKVVKLTINDLLNAKPANSANGTKQRIGWKLDLIFAQVDKVVEF